MSLPVELALCFCCSFVYSFSCCGVSSDEGWEKDEDSEDGDGDRYEDDIRAEGEEEDGEAYEEGDAPMAL